MPTGDADRGLGNHHVSLEPALLGYVRRRLPRLGIEAEVRDWIPIGGTDFAGNTLRYGVGAHYDLFLTRRGIIAPVVEVVGWTFLDGKTAIVTGPGQVTVEDAAGDTIVNLKLGVRAGLGARGDLYFGYGTPLTGERWYDHIFRVEWRYSF